MNKIDPITVYVVEVYTWRGQLHDYEVYLSREKAEEDMRVLFSEETTQLSKVVLDEQD